MCENKFLKQAKEELAYLSGDESFQYLVEARAGFLMDQAFAEAYRKREGHAEGLIDGRKEKQIEIAKKMLAKNMSIEDIIELTGLSKDQVLQLLKI